MTTDAMTTNGDRGDDDVVVVDRCPFAHGTVRVTASTRERRVRVARGATSHRRDLTNANANARA